MEKNINNFRIIRHAYHDKRGELERTHYTIKEYKYHPLWSIFRGWYWKIITHTTGGMGDTYQTATKFDTQLQAETFIKDILCPNKMRDGWSSKIVNELNCDG